MLPKAKAIEDAIRGGVPRVHVISYKLPDSLLLEVFTNEGTGTLVVNSIDALTPAEQQQSVKLMSMTLVGQGASRSMSGCCATRPVKTTSG